MTGRSVPGQGPLGEGQPDPDGLQVLPEVEPLVWFHLGDPARLKRGDQVGHALP